MSRYELCPGAGEEVLGKIQADLLLYQDYLANQERQKTLAIFQTAMFTSASAHMTTDPYVRGHRLKETVPEEARDTILNAGLAGFAIKTLKEATPDIDQLGNTIDLTGCRVRITALSDRTSMASATGTWLDQNYDYLEPHPIKRRMKPGETIIGKPSFAISAPKYGGKLVLDRYLYGLELTNLVSTQTGEPLVNLDVFKRSKR